VTAETLVRFRAYDMGISYEEFCSNIYIELKTNGKDIAACAKKFGLSNDVLYNFLKTY
jgi:lambda repressor-like predicted transcriptional regulator